MAHTAANTGSGTHAVSLPNLLTYGRIVAVPAIAALVWWGTPVAAWVALVLFIAAAVTDFLDGYLARTMNQHSSLGRMLDPIADKLLVGVLLLVLAAVDRIGDWSLIPAAVILSREILVSGLREFLAGLQVSVPVTWLAKWKTTLQLIAIGFLVVGPAGDAMLPGTTLIGLTGLWISGTVTLYTGYEYFRGGIRHLMGEPDA